MYLTVYRFMEELCWHINKNNQEMTNVNNTLWCWRMGNPRIESSASWSKINVRQRQINFTTVYN